ncbi:predicted protein [Streptomyces iranensis]|uniref:Uncharacterized protein n=1 Tax=Streptomyces iranensis TaxID=576784 RepID=A0A061A4C5_9ACTN|nr:predicted protein [Streptomyces iranensis]
MLSAGADRGTRTEDHGETM